MAYSSDVINHEYIQFYRMNQYQPDELYRFFKVEETNHDLYGKGYRAFVEDHEGMKTKVQLPKKYLGRFPDTEVEIQKYVTDIEKGCPPFLVYRKTLVDKSYDIDILPYSEDRDDRFVSHAKEIRVSHVQRMKRKCEDTSSASESKTAKKL